MDVFHLRKRVIEDYSHYANSFIHIRDQRIREKINQETAQGAFWPDPLIQLNPNFQSGAWIKDLVRDATLQPFAQDVGYQGAPFIWDEDRRFLMRCELDALYFHLYGISRDDVDYIMETFPIVKRKDIAATSDENGEGGTYRTKAAILQIYDAMAQLPTMDVPAPKGDGTIAVPDVSQYQPALNPPPADPSVAHEDRRS